MWVWEFLLEMLAEALEFIIPLCFDKKHKN